MTREKFMTLLQRNFGESDSLYFGINRKFYNSKQENPFGREFDEMRVSLAELPKIIKKNRTDFDLYLCFTPIDKGEQRFKSNAKDTYIIAQDIDGVPIPEDLPPSYYWETSPGKFQGVWIMDNKLTPKEQEEINRKLIAKYGFDATGADVVHYYRIPGTLNHKYASTFKVSGLQGNGTVYRKRDFIKALKDVVPPVYVDGDTSKESIPLGRFDLDDLLDKYKVETDYIKGEGIDKSSWSFRIGMKMARKGATKAQVKFVILNAPEGMQKFTEKTVDSEVHRIFAKMEAKDYEDKPKHKLDQKVSPPDLSGISKKGVKENLLSVVKVSDIEPYDDKDFWLIEDFWQNGSVGIVGAPSKSFKSTLTLNLACAVATGRPFDGRKVKQGPVLIVQGENSLSIEQSKIYSITGETDLPIYFVDSNWDMTKIMHLKDTILKLGIKLLIIDPMYLLFGAGDINKHQDITERLTKLSLLRDQTGCSIMLVHHSRKLERGAKIQTADMYGSAFIEGWYESMLLLQRTGVQSSRLVTYFRNHKSGDVYNLVVDDNMGCKAYKQDDSSDFDKQEAKVDSILPKEKEE